MHRTTPTCMHRTTPTCIHPTTPTCMHLTTPTCIHPTTPTCLHPATPTCVHPVTPTSILPPVQSGHSSSGHLRSLALDIHAALGRGGVHMDVEDSTKLAHFREDVITDIFLPTSSALTVNKVTKQGVILSPWCTRHPTPLTLWGQTCFEAPDTTI